MNNIDKQYQDLLKDILENGTKKKQGMVVLYLYLVDKYDIK